MKARIALASKNLIINFGTTRLSKSSLNLSRYGNYVNYFKRGLATTNLSRRKSKNDFSESNNNTIDDDKINKFNKNKNKIEEINKIINEKKKFYDNNYTLGFINYELLEGRLSI